MQKQREQSQELEDRIRDIANKADPDEGNLVIIIFCRSYLKKNVASSFQQTTATDDKKVDLSRSGTFRMQKQHHFEYKMQHKAKKTTGESKPMVRDLALTLVVANYFANAGFYVRNSGSMC